MVNSTKEGAISAKSNTPIQMAGEHSKWQEQKDGGEMLRSNLM
jgi:hypothetical protein